ncbi:uncharacterized protein OCT59_018987 [Rhizophagus irregularis]|uniref:F-box domain-containing protein n=2 Tax=Rhizophagus irregularis TaxID=588596 RepID=A0A015JI70_RHIIW|nr:hypothetical protein GLOIN_2v1771961 [Rhizophagus irregularis DAOM 181602=DAOM 197198]EXX66835.1 hypothetical protein RirG_120030 [Rhizophagus irregularis DAOM 197198w]POG73969.1 hypothetical protein GLOIN_2v1771961 [Rhizophagus irregularis DAOM 181602=DAOM 197198]UZO26774.1 hypothetical protein OCT59_018987 [Rhizophagus irregularis]GBC34148.1 hypothetical protein GLOIN_2v1771961 [Rhizophagus irregularis DAOM 181602=DAOM 197198]|eukprot:XP_025180835.1 hypothetical protein GLOIN_2v1771961 [Rhizophagus irregularis DAOM 181602=DAOM 197198]
MSCSKIFSGELPELTYEIIKYFQNDFSTLHSCILVNRLWYRLAIPLLWENPFSISTGNCNFIEIYLYNLNLNDDLKTELNKYDIDKLLPSNTLFNYPSFIKYLNTQEFISSVGRWAKAYLNLSKKLVISLFKIFIENDVNLHTLEIELTHHGYLSYINNEIIELILQNTNFIHNIKYLKLYNGKTPGFLYFNNNPNEDKLTKDRISQIINLHRNLKKIVLDHTNFPSYQPLLLSKGSNCSNTLNTITLYSINFKSIINLDKLLEQLNVLESVHIFHCYPINTGFIQQIINLSKPFKLKSLFINDRSQIDQSLQLLLQKYGAYLENLGCGFRSNHDPLSKELIESIIKYCKNIKLLDLHEYNNQIIYPALNLIENIKQNLNYLTINIFEPVILRNIIEYIKYSSIILQDLGQILPSRLEYLSLTLHIKASNFKLFLESSKNTFIKKLLINNEDGDDILPYVKKYIMKKKRVKYLAIKNSFHKNASFHNKDLFYLKDEVEEFGSYNIKLQNYNDSIMGVYNYIKETY